MKEIRHYIRRINDYPSSLVQLDTLLPEPLWNDLIMGFSHFQMNRKALAILNWGNVKQDKNLLGLHSILCYLMSDPIWKEENIPFEKLVNFLKDRLPQLCSHVKPYTEWIRDGERSEELVRALLSYLGLIPEGESEKYFTDRLRSIDTLERIQILEESKKAQERAKEILRKIKQAEEEEAASKYNRE